MHQPRRRPRRHYLLPYITLAYTLLLIYGSLYPLSGWQWPHADNWYTLFEVRPRFLSRSDLVTNVLVYIPFGLLVAFALQSRRRWPAVVAVTLGCGAGLSLSMETLQLFLAGRVSSLTDILTNTIGTALGTALSLTFSPRTALGRRLRALRHYWFQSGRMADLGLVILGLWTLAELSPLIPVLSGPSIAANLLRLWQNLSAPSSFNPAQALSTMLYVTALGFLTTTLLQKGRHLTLLFPAFIIAVLLLKVPLVSRQVTWETIAGFGAGVALFLTAGGHARSRAALFGIIAVTAGYLIGQWGYSTLPALELPKHFNWIPFRSQIGRATRLADILAAVWPFLAAAYLVLVLNPRNTTRAALLGAALVVTLSFSLEWRQRLIAAGYPDITPVILALAAWVLPWLHPVLRRRARRHGVKAAEKKEAENPSN